MGLLFSLPLAFSGLMAPDNPELTKTAMWVWTVVLGMIYGLLIGFITVIIRLFGGLTEGVMYAILLGNAATPLIDQLTQPKVFGQRKAETEKESG